MPNDRHSPPTPPVRDVIHQLVAHRKASGLRQNQVAERMGTTPAAVSLFENCRRSPLLETVIRYAAAINATTINMPSETHRVA